MVRTTRVDAINEMLTLIGVNTIASLDDPLRQDVIAAEQTLDESLKMLAVQNSFYNTFEDVTLDTDVNGFIYISDDIYNVELKGDGVTKALIKGDRVYNHTDKTFVWDGPQEFEVQYYLDFADLPEVVMRYIIHAAARKLYLKLFGPSQHLQYLVGEEKMHYDIWQRWEADQADLNMLNTYDSFRVWGSPRRAGRNSRR